MLISSCAVNRIKRTQSLSLCGKQSIRWQKQWKYPLGTRCYESAFGSCKLRSYPLSLKGRFPGVLWNVRYHQIHKLIGYKDSPVENILYKYSWKEVRNYKDGCGLQFIRFDLVTSCKESGKLVDRFLLQLTSPLQISL